MLLTPIDTDNMQNSLVKLCDLILSLLWQIKCMNTLKMLVCIYLSSKHLYLIVRLITCKRLIALCNIALCRNGQLLPVFFCPFSYKF